MSYVCESAPLVSNINRQPFSFSHIGVEAVRGLFLLLLGITWVLLGALLFFCAQTLVTSANLWDQSISVVIILLFGWAFFPRLDSPPPAMMCISETEFPALYGMVAQLAQTIGVPIPQIVLTHQYTAGFGRFGWQHKPVLFLGHGLLSILNKHETTLLLAHELYHAHTSGWGQTRLAKITIGGIHRLIVLFSLQGLRKSADVPRWMRLPLAPLMLLMYAFQWSMAYEMRHIEAQADEAALVLSPYCAMETLLQKAALRHAGPVQDAYNEAAPAYKYEEIRYSAENVDPVGFSRLWQGILQAEAHVFDRHPTVAQRIKTAQRIGQQRVRSILPTGTYKMAHQELKRWPVWLDELDQILSPYLD